MLKNYSAILNFLNNEVEVQADKDVVQTIDNAYWLIFLLSMTIDNYEFIHFYGYCKSDSKVSIPCYYNCYNLKLKKFWAL